MDTDNLSNEAYNGILVEAEKFNHDLTLQFGLLSSECEDETEYIDKSKKLAEKIMKFSDSELEDMFFGNPPDKIKLKETTKRIIKNIEKIIEIPLHKRQFNS